MAKQSNESRYQLQTVVDERGFVIPIYVTTETPSSDELSENLSTFGERELSKVLTPRYVTGLALDHDCVFDVDYSEAGFLIEYVEGFQFCASLEKANAFRDRHFREGSQIDQAAVLKRCLCQAAIVTCIFADTSDLRYQIIDGLGMHYSGRVGSYYCPDFDRLDFNSKEFSADRINTHSIKIPVFGEKSHENEILDFLKLNKLTYDQFSSQFAQFDSVDRPGL